MYTTEQTRATFYRNQGDLEQAADVAARLVRSAKNRAGKVEEIQVIVRVIGEIRLRPGEEK